MEPELAAAVIAHESAVGGQYAMRYEPKWKYWYEPWTHASRLGSSLDTEKIGQATSFGYCQIMGSVARELGFRGWFGELYNPALNINLGTSKLAKILDRYRDPMDVLAAYNGGSARRGADGKLEPRLQQYADTVMAIYLDMKRESPRPTPFP